MQTPATATVPTDAKSFARGDLLIAATDVEEATLDFRKGIKGRCRILHCDPAFRLKQEIYTGEEGLLVGLAIDPISGELIATNPQGYSVLCYGPDGRPRPGPTFLPQRRFGNLVFRKDGTALIGVHSFHGHAAEDAYGDGKLVAFDPRARTFTFHDVAIDGGRGGKHCISNLALSADEDTVFYVSEAGRRVLRYRLSTREQLPDLLAFAADDPRGTYGVQVLADGRVLMALGIGAAVFSADGTLTQQYDVPERKGWTRAKLARDGQHFYLGNFLDGLLQKRELNTGRVVAEFDVQRKGSLTSVVEVP
jgi:hypothetical protein